MLQVPRTPYDAMVQWLRHPIVQVGNDPARLPRLWEPREILVTTADMFGNYTMWRNVASGARQSVPLPLEGCSELTLFWWAGSHFQADHYIDWTLNIGMSGDSNDFDLAIGPDTDAGAAYEGRVIVPINASYKVGGQVAFNTKNNSATTIPLGRRVEGLFWNIGFTPDTGSIPVSLWVLGR